MYGQRQAIRAGLELARQFAAKPPTKQWEDGYRAGFAAGSAWYRDQLEQLFAGMLDKMEAPPDDV